MIRRAPSWAWLTLVGAATLILIVGAVITFSGNGEKPVKAAPVVVSEGEPSLQGGQSRTYTLLGFDQKIGPVVDMNSLTAGSHVRPSGSQGAEVCFEDETCGPISSDFGTRGGPVWLRGPDGGTVTIKITPPD